MFIHLTLESRGTKALDSCLKAQKKKKNEINHIDELALLLTTLNSSAARTQHSTTDVKTSACIQYLITCKLLDGLSSGAQSRARLREQLAARCRCN